MKEQTRVIILDTNIISYFAQAALEKSIESKLHELSQQNFTFALSKFTGYEILRQENLPDEKAVLRKLNLFEAYDVTETVLFVSALFYTMIKSVNKDRKLHDGDVIIAATTFLNASLILTANRDDFAYPYFEEVETTPVLYHLDSQPGKTHCVLLCLLKPNNKEILKYINKKLSK